MKNLVSNPAKYKSIFTKISAGFAALVMILSLTGCLNSEAKGKEFTKEGLTITLNETFKEEDLSGYTVGYTSNNMAVLGLEEKFTLIEDDSLSLKEYAELVVEVNELDENTVISEADGLTSFTFEADSNGQKFSYFASVYKSKDAYWLVQFGCLSKDFAKLKTSMIEFAKTVKVD